MTWYCFDAMAGELGNAVIAASAETVGGLTMAAEVEAFLVTARVRLRADFIGLAITFGASGTTASATLHLIYEVSSPLVT